MQILLTNVGQRWLENQVGSVIPETHPQSTSQAEYQLLGLLAQGRQIQAESDLLIDPLLSRGLIEFYETALDETELKFRLSRNPLENLDRVAIEFTTECALGCLHCRNRGQRPTTEANPQSLFPAIDLLVSMGILRFDFIGGEVTKFGTGWLEVVRHIRTWSQTSVAVLTSGWFLEKQNFKADQHFFRSDMEFMQHLKQAGVTHLTFSLDGPRRIHDTWRGTSGLHDRVLAGIGKAREVGLQPQVSILNRQYLSDTEAKGWLLKLAETLYDQAEARKGDELIHKLLADEQNYVSNLVDVGGAARMRQGLLVIDDVPDHYLRCKNFFRPSPTIRLNATGEVTTCPLMGDATGFGNLHKKSLLTVLNQMQSAALFRLHAQSHLPDYRHLLRKEVFGTRIDHVCTLRVALTRLALRMEEERIQASDTPAIDRLNREIAQSMGMTMEQRSQGH